MTTRAMHLKRMKLDEENNSRDDSVVHEPNVDVEQLHEELMSLWPVELAKYKPNKEDAPLNHAYYRSGLRKFNGKNRRPKMIVIAESPAQTPKSIVGKLPTSALPENTFHCGHTNLVSCLSYGEGWLLGEDKDKKKHVTVRIKVQGKVASEKLEAEIGIKPANNKGTPIFWKVLSCLALQQSCGASLCDKSFDSAFTSLSGAVKREKRLATKIDILNKLDELGICLVDISPVPVYLGAPSIMVKNKKTGIEYRTPSATWKNKDLETILKASWESYLKPILLHYKPRSILVLGKRVGDAIGEQEISKLSRDIRDVEFLGVLPHPSARSLPGVKYLPQYRYIAALANRCVQQHQQQQPNNRDQDAIIPTLSELKLQLDNDMWKAGANTCRQLSKNNSAKRKRGSILSVKHGHTVNARETCESATPRYELV